MGATVKVVFVFGTRPEAIKLAPIIKTLKNNDERFLPKVCVTAQHREMLDQVLQVFGITPTYDLDIMQANQTLFEVTARGLKGLQQVLEAERPDCVLVQGDTTTTFIGALAAFYFKIPVGHVEAGLRTADKYHPFPEEGNRRLTSHLADLHFAPTETARDNLLREGISPQNVWVTGNTVIDALLTISNALSAPHEKTKWQEIFSQRFGLALNHRPLILVTGHRRESFGQGFENICQALKTIAVTHPQVDIVYPIHLNPNVQEPVRRILRDLTNVHLLPPLEYVPFVYLMKCCYLILTDSGGVQEEAPALDKPVLVMREVTERPEAVSSGAARLVGVDPHFIVSAVTSLLTDSNLYRRMATAPNPYGDGKAAERIVALLTEWMKKKGVEERRKER
jgi:UDP-N-acetylglucosamine 2-epimerase (non-hydrolysing)